MDQRTLEEWDASFVENEVRAAEESAVLEKKASDKFTSKDAKEELAKQVSAFSNSGQGYVVYGIDKAKHLDDGVPMAVGRQSTKEWVEQVIPTLLFPAVTQCKSRLITVPGHHVDGRAVLVVSVPLSEHRPHWTAGPEEVAYIRAGEHSVPMRRQTFLDIASRGNVSAGEIVSINPVGEMGTGSGSGRTRSVVPIVRLVNGPICERWGFELAIKSGDGFVKCDNLGTVRDSDARKLYILGDQPLFPGSDTPVSQSRITIGWDAQTHKRIPFSIAATLYTGAASPICRVFGPDDLLPAG